MLDEFFGTPASATRFRFTRASFRRAPRTDEEARGTGRDGRAGETRRTRRRMRTRRSSRGELTPPGPDPRRFGPTVDDDRAGAQRRPESRSGSPPAPDTIGDVAPSEPARSVAQALTCRPEDVRKPSRRPRGVHGGGKPGGGDPSTRHHDGMHRNYMAYKIEKLGEQNDVASTGQTGVFAGVSVYVNGLTDPPWMDIKEIMLANGGKFANYYSRSTVTHVVCQRLTNAKLDALARSDRDHPPVVTPAWVTGSLAAGRLLPCAEFALEGTLEPGVRRMTSLLPRAEKEKEKEKEKPPSTDPATEETDGDETEEDADDDVLPTQDDVDVDDDGAPAEPDPRTPRESKNSTDAGFEPVTLTRCASSSPPPRSTSRTVARGREGGVRGGVRRARGGGGSTSDRARRRGGGVGGGRRRRGRRGRGGDVRSEAAAVAAALAAAGVPATAAPVKVPDVPRGGTVAVVLAAVSSRRGNPEVTGSNPGGGVRAGALKSAMKTPAARRGDDDRDRGRSVRWSNRVAEDIAGNDGTDDDAVTRRLPVRISEEEEATTRDTNVRPRPSPASTSMPPPPPTRRSSFFADAANPSMDRIDPALLAAMPPEVRAELMHGTGGGSGRAGSRGGGPNQPSLRRFMAPASSGESLGAGSGGSGGGSAGVGATKRGWDAFGSILGMRRGNDAKRVRPSEPAEPVEPVEPVAEAAFGSNLPESYSQIDGSFLEAIGEEERARLREHYRAVAENRGASNAEAPGRIELEGHEAGEEEVDDGATGEDVVVALVADGDVDAFRAALEACVEGADVAGAAVDVDAESTIAGQSSDMSDITTIAGDILAAQCEAQCEAHHLESAVRLMLCGKAWAERRGPGSAWAAAFERARVRVAEAVRREYDGAELFLG